MPAQLGGMLGVLSAETAIRLAGPARISGLGIGPSSFRQFAHGTGDQGLLGHRFSLSLALRSQPRLRTGRSAYTEKVRGGGSMFGQRLNICLPLPFQIGDGFIMFAGAFQ